jgi:transcriptional regulator with XRE-family HTH domain
MDADTPTPDKLYFYRFAQAGLNHEDAARLIGVSETTLRRWEAGRQRISTPAFRLLQQHAQGITQAGPWKGWRVYHGILYTPEGIGITPGEIRALPYLRELVRELRNYPPVTPVQQEGVRRHTGRGERHYPHRSYPR